MDVATVPRSAGRASIARRMNASAIGLRQMLP
jgi:hypothetical protein